MIKKYFPKCTVDEPIKPPVMFAHMISVGAVPQKCSKCLHFFEGECLRSDELYLHLDHGPCEVTGNTEPTPIDVTELGEGRLRTRVELQIPQKCASCSFLKLDPIFLAYCSAESEI